MPHNGIGHLAPLAAAAQNGSLNGDLANLLRLMRAQERICVFIDNSNLFHALRSMDLGSKRMNYHALREVLADGRTPTIRFYYSVPQQAEDSCLRRKQEQRSKFYEYLENKAGYTMICLPLREKTVMVDGIPTPMAEEKGLDAEIVYDMAVLCRTGRYNSFVLVSGDEDFARVVRRIQTETGMPVEVAFFGSAGCSASLVKEASKFIDLDKLKDKLLREQTRPEMAEV